MGVPLRISLLTVAAGVSWPVSRTAAGFEVTDTGILSLNPLTARILGIDGSLSAKRAATDDQIDIQIRTPDGLIFPSRLLQIHWRKISEMPVQPAPPPASPQPASAGGS